MSAANNFHGDCVSSTAKHHKFDNISVKCVFKCKGPGYKTYGRLHKHYLDVHQICLHRVATLDPDNEDEFRKQVTSSLAPLTVQNATPQGSHLGRRSSHVNQLPVTSPPHQLAGPSRLSGHQMPDDTSSHLVHLNGDRVNLSSFQDRHAIPVPTASPHQSGPRLPSSGNVGPSRSPATHPTTRHQPYPQFHLQRQGSPMRHTLARGQVNGFHREIPSTPVNHGLQTPKSPSPVARPEHITATVRHHGEISPYLTTGPQRAATGITTSTPLTQVTRGLVETTASGNPRRPATARGRMFSPDSTQKARGSLSAPYKSHTQSLSHQLYVTATGSSGPAMYLPTPPMGTDSLPDSSSRLSLPMDQPKHPQRPETQKRNHGLRGTPTVSSAPLSPRAAKRVVSHPYKRPANGSAASQPSQQPHENHRRASLTDAVPAVEASTRHAPFSVEGDVKGGKETLVPLSNPPTQQIPHYIRLAHRHGLPQPEESTSVVSPQTPTTILHNQIPERGFQQLDGVQFMDETFAKLPGPQLSCVRAEELPQPPTPSPAGRPPTDDEIAAPVQLMGGSNLVQVPAGERSPDESHLSYADRYPLGSQRSSGDRQDTFPDTSWEGLGLIETPDGLYFPEAFDPHAFETFTDLIG